jgi:hypothetical protein
MLALNSEPPKKRVNDTRLSDTSLRVLILKYYSIKKPLGFIKTLVIEFAKGATGTPLDFGRAVGLVGGESRRGAPKGQVDAHEHLRRTYRLHANASTQELRPLIIYNK